MMWVNRRKRDPDMTNSHRAGKEDGFTFIEVLMVVVIIGILTGIAIQALASTRATAFDARAIHDLANAVRAQEALYASEGSYVSVSVTGPIKLNKPAMVVSGSVTLTLEASQDDSFVATAASSRGTGNVFKYDSNTGLFTS